MSGLLLSVAYGIGRPTLLVVFGLSLDAFKVERPSLMFVKVEDELKLDANLVFTK